MDEAVTADSVHVVEPLGRGGIFQHSMELARLLSEKGFEVTVHTARDHENLGLSEPITVCGCISWFRNVKNPLMRRAAFMIRFVTYTTFHIRKRASGSTVHVQGAFRSPLYSWLLAWCTFGRSGKTLFSPHNTFSRTGRGWEVAVLRFSVRRLTDIAIVYNMRDEELLSTWRADTRNLPLVFTVPRPDVAEISAWRQHLCGRKGDRLIMVPGQVRGDKGIEAVMQAVALLGAGYKLAVVGEDRGHAEYCRRLAEDLKIDVAWALEYLPLDAFVAAIAAADVVVLAYEKASQSGILELTESLRVPSVSSDVGGLKEKATVVSEGLSAVQLARAIQRALAGQAPMKHGLPCPITDFSLFRR